jgi:RNA polymerase sigma factor (sigma-70 family)
MAGAQLTSILQHLQQLVGPPDDRRLSDAELLQRFRTNRDETAFRLLMERHGRMVLSVCSRVLRQRQDAEDAFQAAFLILARNAASIRKGTALGSWLYGVAYRTALKARRQMSRRQKHEKRAGKAAQTDPDLNLAWQELQAVLTEEVGRLPEKYRAPFVLCCLEGASKSEAAHQLGWKEGTVSGRLAEARKRLQQRLTRRGLTLSAALCAGAWEANAAAAVPAVLLRTTSKAALGIAAGQTATGVVSAPVAALVEGVTRTMFLSKAKLAGILLLAAGVAAGVGSRLHRVFATPAAGEQPASAPTSKAAKPSAEKPAATKDDKLTLRGRVLDPDGKPLADGRVFLPGAVWGSAEKGDHLLAQKTAAEDGRFRVTIRRSDLQRGRFLIAAAKGYGLDWKEADKLGSDEVTFRLVPDLPVAGRVLDLEGRPVQGASVHVTTVEAPPEGDLGPVLKTIQNDGNRVFRHPLRAVYMAADSGIIAPVKTDEQGRFRINGVGKERIAVLRLEGPSIEHQSLYVLTRRDVNIKELVKMAPDRLGGLMSLPRIYGPTFEHLAGPTKPITGIVRDRATGKPLADVWINGNVPNTWWENYVRAKTDKDGRYRLIGLPKARSYHVSVWGLRRDYIQAGKDVGDSAGLTPLTLDFELVRGVRVRGRITDKATGKPVPAAIWYIPLADNKHFAAMPGKDAGLFAGLGHRNEKDGSYNLLALPGLGLIKVRAEVEGNPYMQAALDPADRPRAYGTNPDEGLGVTFLGAGQIIETLSGHNAYRIIDPAADADSVTCDFSFDRGRTRTGVVVDPDGKPLTGVRVNGLTAFEGNKTLADNSFTAVALNPAEPRLLAFAHKERKLVGHLHLAADAKEPVRVRLQPAAVLTGRLLDEDGKPLAGITVSASHRANPVRRVTEALAADQPVVTGADGRFRIEGIFPGLGFGLSLHKGDKFLEIDEKYNKLTLEPATKDLGDITAKPFRPD